MPARRALWLRALALAAAFLGGPATAQESTAPSPVLTIDQEALFARSAYGRRIQAEIEAAASALAAENRAIEAELTAEERALTEERAAMDPEAFRARAAEFDDRVVEIRRAQSEKERDILARPETARQEFFRATLPVLTELVRERGAVAILDTRAVILSADAIDITEAAIARIDAVLGDGASPPEPAPGGP
jgi:Skp family chaperone for outer membrane proteins